MIRRARLFDLSKIVPLTKRFYETTSYVKTNTFDNATVLELATKLIQNGIVFVVELDDDLVGVMGVSVHPFLFNKNELVSGEVIWYVSPEAQGAGWGKKLLKAVDEECKGWGIVTTQLFLMADSPPVARALYESMGYKLTELSFTKEF